MLNMLKRFYLSLFFARRFYVLLVAIVAIFILSFGVGFFFGIALIGLLALLVVLVIDYFALFSRKDPVSVERHLPERMSNGDENEVRVTVSHRYPFPVRMKIIDELPDQFQRRDFSLVFRLEPATVKELSYSLRPVERGEYHFHAVNVFVRSPFGLVSRRKILPMDSMVKVMPSFLQMKKYELLALGNSHAETGHRRIRKMGQSMEFEQIKEYVSGDDLRTLNWKATARKGGQLMVNTFTDEKSQQVYCVIDKGRIMKMPFEGMSLLDYAVNAALVLSRVALLKQDKAGLVTFADQLGTFLPAGRKDLQMRNIMELLYNQQTHFLETDYEKLYALVRTRITQRSLIVLFTNFESLSGLQRQLPYIRAIARTHLVLVVFFENTGLKQLLESPVHKPEDLYMRTIAEKFAFEKRLIVKELKKHGILTILTPPESLTVHTVNKYLEIKARLAI